MPAPGIVPSCESRSLHVCPVLCDDFFCRTLSVLQPCEAVANLAQFTQAPGLEPGLEIQDLMTAQFFDRIAFRIEFVDRVSSQRKGRTAHLRLGVLNGDQQGLAAESCERGEVLNV